ncbi:MAG: hypothetical protein NVSMB25_20220 [Thermoleophilaceae bacterium]
MLYFGRSVSISVRYFTDPACSWSWGTEPVVRRLMLEFGDELAWTYVMGGLARDYRTGHADPEAGFEMAQGVYPGLVADWLDVSERSGMPFDPRIWLEEPIASTYPACMAVKAAGQQAADGGYRYLRAVSEGLMCFRRKLDTTEALVEEARRAGLDTARMRSDLGSNATVEAFSADLEAVREIPEDARREGRVARSAGHERLSLPSMCLGEGPDRRWVFAGAAYDEYREAARAAGAEPTERQPPSVIEALRRFGRMATRELEVVCGLPGPRANAELWRLAAEWQVRPLRVLTGHLWELA